jgi:dihydroflavonol-4-reductase
MSATPRPIFVTGGTGFIGSRVVNALVARRSPVRCLTRPASRLERIAHMDCERVIGDVTDRSSLEQAMKGCAAIVHLAGLVKPAAIHSEEMFGVHVNGTRNVLEAAVRAGVRRMVYVSSTAAIGGSPKAVVHDERHFASAEIQRLLLYSRAKVEAEKLCREFGDAMAISVVNPAEVFGPGDTDLITAGSLLDFATSNPVIVCAGGFSVAHVDDVAAGVVAAIDRGRPGERYVLSGENLTVRQLAGIVLDILKLKRWVITAPRPVIRGVAYLGGILKAPLPFDPELVPFATSYWFMDNSKARRELGVEFRDARSTLSATLDWLQASGHLKLGEATT